MHTNSRKRIRPLRWYIIWYLILFFFLTTIISIILTLPIWRIRETRVVGAQILSEEAIINIAKVPLGENLFVADLSESINALKAIPQLKNFGVYRRPPFTIVLKLIERKPLATAITNKETLVIDEEGVILKRSGFKGIGKYKLDPSIKNISNLPIIKGVRDSWISSDRLNSDALSEIEKAIIKLSKYLESPSLQIDLTDQNDINLMIDDVLRVKLGDTDDLERKIENLIVLLSQVSGRWSEVDYIDVRFEGVPVIKFRS